MDGGLWVAIYPCGCSASGQFDIPRYCSAHDPDSRLENQCAVLSGVKLARRKTSLPTIEEIAAQAKSLSYDRI
jgi:hypothetical protein